MNEILKSHLQVANVHIKRLEFAMKRLAPHFPITVEKLSQLTDEDLAIFELYTSRFSKLQDLMGAQLFTLILSSMGESVDDLSMIDKVNRLEKLRLIDSAEEWFLMRQIRNHLAHEYPDNPDITVKYLNEAYSKGALLIQYFNKLSTFDKGRSVI